MQRGGGLRIVQQIRRDLVFLLPVVLASALGGLFLNGLRQNPLPLLRQPEDVRLAMSVSQRPLVNVPSEPAAIDLGQAMENFESGSAVFVDAREEAFYSLGHIPKALNLPRSEFAKAYPGFASQAAKTAALILYCSERECQDGLIVAKALLGLGFSDVRVFLGGWQEWKEAGLPQEP